MRRGTRCSANNIAALRDGACARQELNLLAEVSEDRRSGMPSMLWEPGSGVWQRGRSSMMLLDGR